MPDIDDVRKFLADESGLAVVSTVQSKGPVLSSVVNCGVLAHPVTGATGVALVSRGTAARVTHVRRGSPVTIAIRRGWRWVSVSGAGETIGPDDLPEEMDAEGLRLLLRDVFRAAGGEHDDYDEYDRAMADERRVAILVSADRILGSV